MILHIPHSSTVIKNLDEYKNIQPSLDLLTDWFTDELFQYDESERIVFPYSRLWCDVERYKDPSKEEMEKYGQGIVYIKDCSGEYFRTPSDTTINEVLKEYYNHHELLTSTVKNHLSFFKEVCIVDCHSFYPGHLPFQSVEEKPDFCIGCNERAPVELIQNITNYLRNLGFTVFINNPYSGSIIPEVYENDPNVHSILIEVNKELYLTAPDYKEKNSSFIRIQNYLTNILEIISDFERAQDV